MLRPVTILLLSLATLVPVGALRQDEAGPPESLLAAESVAYLRFDGFAPERAAYRKTILAGLLSDQFGPLIEDLTGRLVDALGPQALGERLLAGTDPAQLLEVQVALKQLPRLVEYFDEHGFAMGVEVVDPTAQVPEFQITFVFPEGGLPENRSALFGGMRLLGLLAETDIASVREQGRSLLVFDEAAPARVAAWQEGRHVLLTIGTLDLERTFALAAGERPNLAGTETFAAVERFDAYPTAERGFVDVDGVIDLVERSVPALGDVLVQLGFRDLKNVRFHVGYEGKLLRTTVVLDTPGERRGLMQLLAPEGSLDPDDLPPLPPDASSVMSSTIDLAGTYDTFLGSIDDTLKAFSPLVKPQIEQGLAEMQRVLGVDLRTDVLAALDSPIVLSSWCGDGPFGLGLSVAIKAKDPEKLRESLDKVSRSLVAFADANLRVSTREVHGVTLTMIDGSENNGNIFKPTYAIHGGWLVVGLYPQAVQGFAYRMQAKPATGRAPRKWRMPEAASVALVDARQRHPGARLTGLYISDPRSSVKSLLSTTPFVVQIIAQFSDDGGDFDISLIPNAQSVLEPLYENVTVVVDDGKSIQYEGYATLPLPAGLSSFNAYGFLFGFSLLGLNF